MPCQHCHRHAFMAIVFFVVSLFVAQGQAAYGPIAFDHLTAEDGLSHNTVYTTLQDQDGLIWVGTRYGLNRYDGYECKVFLPLDTDPFSLAGPTVLSLMEDKKGKIWIGHRGAGISVWDKTKGRFERFPYTADTEVDWPHLTIRRLYEDSRGWLWVATAGSGAFVFDENRQKIDHFCTSCAAGKTISNDFVFDFQEDSFGTVWIATDGRGINAYDAATRSTRTLHSPDALDLISFEKSLCLDLQGQLWIGTAGSGLYRYNPHNQQFDHFISNKGQPGNTISHNIITDLALDSRGQLWIATDGGGLNILDLANKRFRHVGSSAGFPQALNTNALYHLMFDNIGNLWVGTFNGGVNIHKMFSPPFLIHQNQNDYGRKGLRSVLALEEGTDGKIWIGTDGGGLFYAHTNDSSIDLQVVGKPGSGFPTPVITCLKTTPEGNLWLGTYADGLTYYHPKTGLTVNYKYDPAKPGSLSHNNVWDIELDESGGLWIATLGGGLNYLPPASDQFKRFQPVIGDPATISSVQLVDVLLDEKRGVLWAASEDLGLNRLDIATGRVQRYTTTSAGARLSGNNIQCLYQDKNGRVWIGTEFKGLNCLDPETGQIAHFGTQNGLPSDMVISISEDEQGHLWVSTQKGMVRRDAQTQTFVNIGADDNLSNNQYNPRAAARLKNGQLVFGGTSGFSILIPNRITPNPHPPKAVFTGLKLSGQRVPIGLWNGRTVLNGDINATGTRVQLSYADRGIVFEFTGTDYTKPSQNKYAYKLEGFDEHWNYAEAGQHQAIYSNLSGGSYVLKIKACNSDQVWGDVQSLAIVVSPPFWKTWWFYLLCTLVVLAITYLVIRFLLDRQKAAFQQQAFKTEQEILRLKNENLEKEVEAKQSRLSASVLQTAHKNQFLEDLKAQILKSELGGKEGRSPEFRKLIRAIDSELKQEDYWEQFQLSFNQMHQDFVHQLHLQHPNLTGNDSRLCCFIRMGFSNAEIASILNITINGVEQSKYRLKKKLDMDKDSSLNEYIWQL